MNDHHLLNEIHDRVIAKQVAEGVKELELCNSESNENSIEQTQQAVMSHPLIDPSLGIFQIIQSHPLSPISTRAEMPSQSFNWHQKCSTLINSVDSSTMSKLNQSMRIPQPMTDPSLCNLQYPTLREYSPTDDQYETILSQRDLESKVEKFKRSVHKKALQEKQQKVKPKLKIKCRERLDKSKITQFWDCGFSKRIFTPPHNLEGIAEI